MDAVRVSKQKADVVLHYLFEIKAVEKKFKIDKNDKCVNVPLLRKLDAVELNYIADLGAELVKNIDFSHRRYVPIPYDAIKTDLIDYIPSESIRLLPDKWELFGDVLTIKIPPDLDQYKDKIAKAYARHLKARTVLSDVDCISGIYRTPKNVFLLGTDAETVHVENGIQFKLDASKIMFASGNMEERKRMAAISDKHETVVDMFAGIGYFSVPMAFYSQPENIYSCEINPIAYNYLLDNIKLNSVSKIIQPLLGDCRKTAPEKIADRIIMGYLDCNDFLKHAVKVLKDQGGVIHYHEACPIDAYERPVKRIRNVAGKVHRNVEISKFTVVKSFAPCIDHVVVDASFGPIR